ncbi:MAG: cysteine hydrolase family protein, partial [Ilumatobacteraceae bacterium]
EFRNFVGSREHEILDELKPLPGEHVLRKTTIGAFASTNIDSLLRALGCEQLYLTGVSTNMCVETTTRMAGNLGFDTYLVPDCCSTSNRIGWDGADYDPELVHDMTVANLHGEFCTAITPGDALGLLAADNTQLERVQGNE